MPRKNMEATINAFAAGRAHQEKTCRTDGQIVWSYAMPIAYRVPGTVDVVIVHKESSPSVTTSGQISALVARFPHARRVASITVTPSGVVS